MTFLNFTQHSLTPEQIEAARAMGATEIVDAKSVLADFSDLVTDDGIADSGYQADKIASAIVELSGGEQAIVHFPVSSPRVQAAFWQYANTDDGLVWKNIRKCRFVFSHTARISQDVPQSDGTVKKTTVFKFEKFVQ